MANEYDTLPDFEWESWPVMTRFVLDHDPYGHLLSNHYCLVPWDWADTNTTHLCLQDNHFGRIPPLQKKYGKPVIFDETGYEGDVPYSWGSLTAFELVDRFWRACVLGGYATHGETYWNEEELLWWAKGGELRGESAPRIGFLRSVLEELPGELTALKPAFDRALFLEQVNDPQKAEEIPHFLRHVAGMEEGPLFTLFDTAQEYSGRCGDKAFLWYYGRQRPAWAEIELPEDKTYDVYALDVWEMTREKVLSGASGKAKVPLPGKEGFAVLAAACEKGRIPNEDSAI